MVSGLRQETQEQTLGDQFPESEVRARGNMKISREGKLKRITRIVRTDKYRYSFFTSIRLQGKGERGFGQKGANTGQGMIERH